MKDLLLPEARLRLLLSDNVMGKNHRRNAISDGKTLQTLENCNFNHLAEKDYISDRDEL